MFICLAEGEEKTQLLDEFWNQLGAANNRKRARKAEIVERIAKKHDSEAVPVFEVLRDEKFFAVDSSIARVQRKAVERRWSFSEIVEGLSKNASDRLALGDVKLLLHM
jgi:hypothetical protein